MKLSPADRAVFDALWRRLTRSLEPFTGSKPLHEGGKWKFPLDFEAGRRAMVLRDSIDAKAPDVPGIVAFVEEFETATPDVMTETQNIRRTKAMSRNQRAADFSAGHEQEAAARAAESRRGAAS